jgi:hypothetical protein
MAEQLPMPDAWVGEEATVTYLAAERTRNVNCTIREVNDRGVGVEEAQKETQKEAQKTAFFPWTSIVRIDLGHHARRGSRTTRAVR